ncbi:MAG: response regulator transcription factor [Chloroflexi bacterium]|nr:response regulator transcription factor [Chloroflexota bacterium]
MSRLKVLLAMGSAQLLREVRSLLEPLEDINLAAEATDGRAALLAVAEATPDVVLMEALLPKLSGLSVTRAVKARWPQTRVLLVSPLGSPSLVRRALEAGADGYLLYSNLPALLEDSLRALGEGAFVIEQGLLRRAIAHPEAKGTVSLGASLRGAAKPRR